MSVLVCFNLEISRCLIATNFSSDIVVGFDVCSGVNKGVLNQNKIYYHIISVKPQFYVILLCSA